MKKIIDWFVYSSADPNKISLTVRGTLVGAIPLLIYLGHIFHLNWTDDSLTLVIEQITATISATLIALGLARKLFITIRDWFKKDDGLE